MVDLSDVSRRHLLGVLGASTTGAIAGCNGDTAGSDSSESATGTASVTSTTNGETSQELDTVRFDGGGAEAFAEALRTLADNPGATLEIAEGTYRFSPSDMQVGTRQEAHFEIAGLRDATIAGNGSRLVFTDPTLGTIYAYGGSNLAVRNLEVDYDPVPFTQGEITAVSRADRTLTLALEDSYPSLDDPMFDDAPFVWGSVHTPDGDFVSGVRREGSLDKHFASISHVDGRRYELTLADGTEPAGLEVGRRMAVVARGFNHALTFSEVEALTLRNVDVRASRAFAIFLGYCEEATVSGCSVATREGSDRLVSSDADGIYCSSNGPGLTIEDCHVEQALDDGIIVSTPTTWVTDVGERSITVENVTGVTAEAGDVFTVKAPDGERKGELPPVSSVEYYRETATTPGVPRTIEFDSPVDDVLDEGDYLANTAYGSEGFTVRNNTVRNNRASLLRLSGGSGVVEGNTLEGSSNPAVEIESNSSREFEGKGWVDDVTIENNRIARSGLNYFAHTYCSAIHVAHDRPGNDTTEGHPHRNLSIVDNEFENHAHLGLNVSDARHVRVESNRFAGLNRLDFDHYFGKSGYAVALENAAQVDVTGNDVVGDAETLYQFGWRRRSEGVDIADNTLTVDGADRSPEFVEPTPVTLAFDETVKPSEVNSGVEDDRPLAFRCYRLSLLTADGDPIVDANVGGPERGVEFGRGVYGAGRSDARWFGGENAESVLSLLDADVAEATRLRLTGYPMVDGISADVSVDGQTTGSVTFGESGTTAEYTVSIDSS